MIGGLLSPPESRYNSPIFPIGSSSVLQMGKFSPPRSVNPRDLHDSPDFFGDHSVCPERDEQEVASLDPQFNSTAMSRGSSLQPSVPDSMFEKPTVDTLEGDQVDEDATMVDVPSRESSPQLPDENETEISASSRDQVSRKADSTMSNVQTGESSPERQVDGNVTMISAPTTVDVESQESPAYLPEDGKEVSPIVVVESREPPSDPRKDDSNDPLGQLSDLSDLSDSPEGDDDQPRTGLDVARSSGDGKMEGGSTIAIKSKGLFLGESDFSALEDDVGGDVRPRHAIDSSESSKKKKIPCPTVRIVAPSPKAATESSVHLASDFEPRRSTRNIHANDKPTANYVDCVPSRKSSSGKKKQVSENRDVPLKARFHTFPSI